MTCMVVNAMKKRCDSTRKLALLLKIRELVLLLKKLVQKDWIKPGQYDAQIAIKFCHECVNELMRMLIKT